MTHVRATLTLPAASGDKTASTFMWESLCHMTLVMGKKHFANWSLLHDIVNPCSLLSSKQDFIHCFSKMPGQLSWPYVIRLSWSRTGKITELPHEPVWCNRCIHKSFSKFDSVLRFHSQSPNFLSLWFSITNHLSPQMHDFIFLSFLKFANYNLWSNCLSRSAGWWKCAAYATGLKHGQGDYWKKSNMIWVY